MSLDNPQTTFLVVVNDEQQYAIWPAYKASRLEVLDAIGTE